MAPFKTALLSALLAASPALAGDLFSVGIGAHALAGVNWLDQSPSLALPGYAGFRTGVGASAELRLLGVVGVEAGLVRSNDRGEGSVSLEGIPTPTQSVGQASWHVPVVAKVVIPLPLIKPFALAGLDFVFPNACSSIGVNCTAGNYAMWVGGVGAEIAVPLPVLDMVRFPVSLRYQQNRDAASLSTRATPDGQTVRAEWGRDLHVTAGVVLLF
ncbi:MAG: hypothetical protein RL653_4192 [Pseudomonadota bacterium]|jgi:hypothetical protein